MTRLSKGRIFIWRAWLTCAAIGFLFVAWGAVTFVMNTTGRAGVLASGDVGMISDFRERRPDVAWHRIDVRGSSYYIAEGKKASALSKGPAIYVFDDVGNFIDWSRDADRKQHPRIAFYEGVDWIPVEETELP